VKDLHVSHAENQGAGACAIAGSFMPKIESRWCSWKVCSRRCSVRRWQVLAALCRVDQAQRAARNCLSITNKPRYIHLPYSLTKSSHSTAAYTKYPGFLNFNAQHGKPPRPCLQIRN
jgi:hypothetical protein